MKILVLNGSPRGEKGNTYKITKAFLEGAGDHTVHTVTIRDQDIRPCTGCFSCWKKTPGRCIIKDDMAELLEEYVKSDAVIWSAPLYYFGLPSQTKAFMDRLLPINLPDMKMVEPDFCTHLPRYDLSNQRQMLISSCGYGVASHDYEALITQFSIFTRGKGEHILCPQGELLKIPQLQEKIDQYRDLVRQAGSEWAAGGISSQTIADLAKPFFPPEAYVQMANASWGAVPSSQGEPSGQKHDQPAAAFIQQMAAVYNPDPLKGKPAVLEINFTDIDQTYQLQMNPSECVVAKEESAFLPYTTRIETPYALWLEISQGTVDGPEAMMQGKYRTLGDFSFMIHLNSIFSSGR